MKSVFGIALALSLALVGCQQQSKEQGGGGGQQAERPGATTMSPDQGAKTGQPGQKATIPQVGQSGPDLIKQASKKAEDARALVARNDLDGAARDVEAARDLIGQARDKAPASLQPKLSNIEKAAARAQASLIDDSKTNDVPSTDALARSLKEMATTEPKVWAGGGKPMPTQ